ncbi:cupin domain-containing protein [Pseudomonas caricapapayae]|uniref:cupin domain-containing protein n=1 Tax=Pseudomonas caricapapayae TaxID=46678 RepID=UPI000F009C8F|nr:cupin domain-containing protein [Pseudomonas caricapapayae]
MKTARLEDMVKGWFVGGFEPAAFKTGSCEVGVKTYKAGDWEVAHYHKVATEITVIISGSVNIRDQIWNAGDIIILEPGDITAFEALTDATTVVVKVPGALADKYVV